MSPSTAHNAARAVLATAIVLTVAVSEAAAQSITLTPLGVGNTFQGDYQLGVGGRRYIKLMDANGRPLSPFPGAPTQWSAVDGGLGDFYVEGFPAFYLRKGDRVDAWFWGAQGQAITGGWVITATNDNGSVVAGKP